MTLRNPGITDGAVYGGGNGLDNGIRGNNRDNPLRGFDGSDTLYGFDGNDTIEGGNNSDYLYGGQGDDNLIRGAGDDKFVGGDGDDLLNGGAGRDRLIGGLGADTFIFNTFEQRTDFIGDFSQSQNDKIQLSQQALKSLGGNLAKGLVDSSQFVLGVAATSADTRLIFNQAKEALYFDADGTGSAKAREILALTNTTQLAASDFAIS